jgi:hypothetical protein
MADLAKIEAGLKAKFDGTPVDELLAAHRDAKTNFYFGGLRLSAVEGGRFCEAAYRLLEQAATTKFTPLGKHLDTEKIAKILLTTNLPESARIHIPRTLRVIYNIRNKRDTAHLGDGIDPNDQDATLVMSAVDWVLAEFVRLHHGITANEAQRIITNIVSRQTPVVQDFGGFLKILNPKLPVSDRILVLLYQRGAEGATFDELCSWVHPKMRKNIKRALHQLEHDKAYIHMSQGVYRITASGIREAERKKIVQLA